MDSPLIPLLADEIVKHDPGQGVVLDRLLDLLLVTALRAWFSQPGAQATAWYRPHNRPLRRARDALARSGPVCREGAMDVEHGTHATSRVVCR